MCNVGLNTVNLGDLTGFQQVVLFILMLMGDLSIVTISVVVVRRHYFSKRISRLMAQSATFRRIAHDIENERESELGERGATGPANASSVGDGDNSTNIHHRVHLPSSGFDLLSELSQSHATGYGSFPAPWHSDNFHRLWKSFGTSKSGISAAEHGYLSFRPKLDHKVGSAKHLDPALFANRRPRAVLWR